MGKWDSFSDGECCFLIECELNRKAQDKVHKKITTL